MVRMKLPASAACRSVIHWAAVLLGVSPILGLSGCAGITDVDNPNVVLQDDVEKPTSASALANGAQQNTARAMGALQLVTEAISDHLIWVGTFDDVGRLNRGEFMVDDQSRYPENAYDFLSVARWMSDEAIRLLEAFDAEGTLVNRNDLARVYLYSAINYASAADMFEDFVISDRQNVQPPIGGENMHTLYGIALERLQKADAIAQATKNSDLQNAVLAWRARVHWARVLWQMMRPRKTPTNPLIDDAQANAAARQLLARAPADWRLQAKFNSATGNSTAGFQINSRREVAFDKHLAEQDASGRAICSPFNSRCSRDGIVLLDPIDKIKDPALRRFLWEFIPAHEFPSVTIVSARELRLILAEGALKRGATGEFATEINAVRALDGLTPYDPAKHSAIDPVKLLIHMRKVNLILQPQRRLLDLYRFGIRAQRWSDAALTVTAPGTVLKMGQKERRSNCYVVGSCK